MEKQTKQLEMLFQCSFFFIRFVTKMIEMHIENVSIDEQTKNKKEPKMKMKRKQTKIEERSKYLCLCVILNIKRKTDAKIIRLKATSTLAPNSFSKKKKKKNHF